MFRRCLVVLIAGWLGASVPGLAQEEARLPKAGPVTLASPIVTHHHGAFNGTRLNYDAVVEPILVADASGNHAARLVAISYIATDVPNAKERPVIFAFNGGPLAPSALVHMGAFGPRRLAVPDDIKANPSTLPVVDNTYSPLDVADVVLFDPAGTGYSRVLEGIDPKSYFTMTADGQQLAQFVIEWSKAHGRAESPKYLVGESYGTMRAVETANQLQKSSMPLNGIVLLGQAVNIIEYAQRPANIISYVVSLPTVAAIAWSHDRADRKGRDFDRFIAAAQEFARTDYLRGLFQGNTAAEAQRRAVAQRLEEFSGISASYYLAHNLSITKEQYRRELFPGQLLALNDARYVGPTGAGDPFSPVLRAYSEALKAHLRDELKTADIGEYATTNPATGGLGGWDWGPNKTPFGDWPYGRLVTEVMDKNPRFRVLVGNGYYDTQTTIGAMDYLVTQSNWPRERVKAAYYQGGHMFYSVEASLRQLMQDIRELIAAARSHSR